MLMPTQLACTMFVTSGLSSRVLLGAALVHVFDEPPGPAASGA
jgi:hypothetical protein